MKKIFQQAMVILSKKDKLRFILLIFLSFILMLFESIGVAIIIPYLNIIVNGDLKFEFLNQLVSSLSQNQLIFFSSLILIIFFVVKNLYIILFNYYQLNFRVNLNKRLASDLLRNYLYMPYNLYFKKNSSEMIREITGSCSDFCNLIVACISILKDILIIFGIFLLIVYLQGIGLFFTLFIFFIACIVFYVSIKKKFKEWGEKRHFFSGEGIKYLIQSLSSPKDIRIFGKQSYFLNIFDNINHKIIYYNFLRDLTSTIPRNIFEIFGIIFITYFLIKELSIYEFEEVIITISVLLVAFLKILPSITSVVLLLSSLKNGQKATSYVYRDLHINIDEEDVKNNENIIFEKNIEFKNINFSFDELKKEKLFNNLNFKINKNDKILIYGDSGAGKSTLVNLLLGLLKPQNGQILVDGKNINSNLLEFRKKTGYVPQEFLMLDDSVKKNIAFGCKDDEIDEIKLEEAIRRSSLKSFIESLPNKQNEIIGERGISISGGQRQRIAIARALYNNPEILIMDEATSGIDIKTENEILSEVLTLNNNKLTLIVISHNLGLKKYFDRSIDLKNYE